MAQWIGLNQNNSFVNLTRSSLLYESGAILLVLVGLTAGRQVGWQLDQILIGSKLFKLSTDRTVRIFTEFSKETLYHRATNVFWSIFWVRCIVRHVVEKYYGE